jgi:hypothetical protein
MRVRNFTTGAMRVYSCADIETLRGRQHDVSNCCSTCHEDDDAGYSGLCETESPDSKDMVQYCCAFIDCAPRTPEDWERLHELFPE